MEMKELSNTQNHTNDVRSSKNERRLSISNVLEEASSVIMNTEENMSLHTLIGMPTSSKF